MKFAAFPVLSVVSWQRFCRGGSIIISHHAIADSISCICGKYHLKKLTLACFLLASKQTKRAGIAKRSNIMNFTGVSFSIASNAAWAPGMETQDAWLAWAAGESAIAGSAEPPVTAMAPMLRRRAGFLGKMALQVAYACLGNRTGVPMIFCSRYGEVARSVELLTDLAQGATLSPTSFGLSVHNATCGLFTIARSDQCNASALAAGHSTIEHAVIEACGLLADGEPAVLLVAYDTALPSLYSDFQDRNEQSHAWAWLIQPPSDDVVSLRWSAADCSDAAPDDLLPAGLEILRFHLRNDPELIRLCDNRQWQWSRNA
jgi:hypothetical protein